jgi:hypothetical protein
MNIMIDPDNREIYVIRHTERKRREQREDEEAEDQ